MSSNGKRKCLECGRCLECEKWSATHKSFLAATCSAVSPPTASFAAVNGAPAAIIALRPAISCCITTCLMFIRRALAALRARHQRDESTIMRTVNATTSVLPPDASAGSTSAARRISRYCISESRRRVHTRSMIAESQSFVELATSYEYCNGREIVRKNMLKQAC